MSNQNELLPRSHLKIINKLWLADENFDDWYTDDNSARTRDYTIPIIIYAVIN